MFLVWGFGFVFFFLFLFLSLSYTVLGKNPTDSKETLGGCCIGKRSPGPAGMAVTCLASPPRANRAVGKGHLLSDFL